MGWNGPAATPIHKTCVDILHSKIIYAHCKQDLYAHDVVVGQKPESIFAVTPAGNEEDKIHAH